MTTEHRAVLVERPIADLEELLRLGSAAVGSGDRAHVVASSPDVVGMMAMVPAHVVAAGAPRAGAWGSAAPTATATDAVNHLDRRGRRDASTGIVVGLLVLALPLVGTWTAFAVSAGRTPVVDESTQLTSATTPVEVSGEPSGYETPASRIVLSNIEEAARLERQRRQGAGRVHRMVARASARRRSAVAASRRSSRVQPMPAMPSHMDHGATMSHASHTMSMPVAPAVMSAPATPAPMALPQVTVSESAPATTTHSS